MFLFRVLIIVNILIVPTTLLAHDASSNDNVRIHMTESGFEPQSIEVEQGTQVIFENKDSVPRWPATNLHPTHTLYPDSDIRDCFSEAGHRGFDACRELQPGEEYSFIFTEVGTWQFHDHLKSQFSGAIVVTPATTRDDSTEAASTFHTETGVFTQFTTWLKFTYLKLYYTLFTHAKEEQLAALDFKEVVHDSAELTYWLKVFGADTVLDDLIADVSGNELLSCHFEGHLIGRAYYQIAGGKPLQNFDNRCQFGYYHGLLEAYIADNGGEDIVSTMITHCDGIDNTMDRRMCLHGMGHGLLVYYNYDLPKAITGCEQIPDTHDQLYCLFGTYMENAVTVTEFADQDVHASPWTNLDDPLFPCNSLIGQSRNSIGSCYASQPLIMLEYYDHDLERVKAACHDAPKQFVHSCYWGLGFYAGMPSLKHDMDYLDRLCTTDDIKLTASCAAGVTEIVTFIWGEDWYDEALAFCDRFPEQAAEYCSTVVNDNFK